MIPFMSCRAQQHFLRPLLAISQSILLSITQFLGLQNPNHSVPPLLPMDIHFIKLTKSCTIGPSYLPSPPSIPFLLGMSGNSPPYGEPNKHTYKHPSTPAQAPFFTPCSLWPMTDSLQLRPNVLELTPSHGQSKSSGRRLKCAPDTSCRSRSHWDLEAKCPQGPPLPPHSLESAPHSP